MTGGWASGDWPRRNLLAYLPLAADDREPAYAIVDAWEPPEPLALPERVCDRILAAAKAVAPSCGPNGAYVLPVLEPADERSVLERFKKANADWWRLDIDCWDVR